MSFFSNLYRLLGKYRFSLFYLAPILLARKAVYFFRVRRILKSDSLQERFSDIYRFNIWSSKESLSGKGSELSHTSNLRPWLVNIIDHYRIKSMVDAPCGDFNWMRHVVSIRSFDYVGLDIVPFVVDGNTSRYGQPNVKFFHKDICRDLLPDCDLLFVRDVLFHLSFSDIDRFLKNASVCNYKYLITTTHYDEVCHSNLDILTGAFRPINLFLPPFSFGRSTVLDEVDDFPSGEPLKRKMIMVAKGDVPISLTN